MHIAVTSQNRRTNSPTLFSDTEHTFQKGRYRPTIRMNEHTLIHITQGSLRHMNPVTDKAIL